MTSSVVLNLTSRMTAATHATNRTFYYPDNRFDSVWATTIAGKRMTVHGLAGSKLRVCALSDRAPNSEVWVNRRHCDVVLVRRQLALEVAEVS